VAVTNAGKSSSELTRGHRRTRALALPAFAKVARKGRMGVKWSERRSPPSAGTRIREAYGEYGNDDCLRKAERARKKRSSDKCRNYSLSTSSCAGSCLRSTILHPTCRWLTGLAPPVGELAGSPCCCTNSVMRIGLVERWRGSGPLCMFGCLKHSREKSARVLLAIMVCGLRL